MKFTSISKGFSFNDTQFDNKELLKFEFLKEDSKVVGDCISNSTAGMGSMDRLFHQNDPVDLTYLEQHA